MNDAEEIRDAFGRTPSATGEPARWLERREIDRDARRNLLDRPAASGDALQLARLGLELAGSNAFLQDLAGLREALVEVAAAGAATLLMLHFEHAELHWRWADGSRRTLPPADGPSAPGTNDLRLRTAADVSVGSRPVGAETEPPAARLAGVDEDPAPAPPLWLAALAAACIVRDGASRSALADTAAVETMLGAYDPVAPPFWAPLCRAFAALVRGEPAAELADRAAELIRNDPDDAIVDFGDAHVHVPLAELIARLDRRKAADWDAAVRAGIALFDRYYGAEDMAHLSGGFLPLGLVAVCVLAGERGIATGVVSPYLPQELLRGDPPAAPIAFELVFEPLRARTSAEIRWWFDLQGVRRSMRSERLIERDGGLVVADEIRGWPAAPSARVEFGLDPANPPLLDAGDLIRVAELQGRSVALDAAGAPVDAGAARMHLQEAIDALDAARDALPADGDALQALRSRASLALWREEPGRFDPERLAAVRMVYADLLGEIGPAARNGSPPTARRDAPSNRPAETFAESTATNDESSALPDFALSDFALPDADPSAGLALAAAARADALAWVAAIRERITPALQALGRPGGESILRELRPRLGDYERVFVGAEAVRLARESYEALWNPLPQFDPPPAVQTELKVYMATAGMLADANELSDRFPGGYRSIAHLLDPHHLWISWTYSPPGGRTGLACDGLVWCDDHWAWLPKPYRALRSLLP